MGGLKILLLFILVILVIGVIVWVWWCKFGSSKKKKGCKKSKKEDCENDEDCCLETLCKDVKKLEKRLRHAELREEYDVQQLNEKISETQAMDHSLLGQWSLNFDTGEVPADPGTLNNVPMLRSAVAQSGTPGNSVSQTPASSVQQAVSDGLLDALTVQVSSTLSAGTVTVTVYVNGLPVLLSAAITTLSSTLLTVKPTSDIAFAEGDTIGISFSSAGAEMTTLPAKFTAQVFVKYTL